LTIVKTSNLLGVAFHHGIALRDLPVATDDNLIATSNAQYGRTP